MIPSGCREYRKLSTTRGSTSRRSFLGLSATAIAAASGWVPRVSFASSHVSDRDVLISLFLRGGADGLSLCVPHGDSNYYRLRPSLSVPRPDSSSSARALDLDGFFGLSPAMARLQEPWSDGGLAFVHACGQAQSNRSHFSAMHLMEVGHAAPPSSLGSGWLGRYLAAAPPADPDALLRAVGLNYGLARTLVGAPRTAPIADPASFDLTALPGRQQALKQTLQEMYAQTADPLRTSAETTFATIDLLAGIDFESYRPPSGAYPTSELGAALRASAALVRADLGVEAIAVDAGGWDTHDEQGTREGAMYDLMQDLAESLATLYHDLSSAGRRFTVCVMSEFGRNATENGSFGTDHGYGSAMLVLGTGVRGGRVIADWPGLAREQLFDGQDLQVRTDYRDVLVEVLQHRLGLQSPQEVFSDPDYTPQPVGLY